MKLSTRGKRVDEKAKVRSTCRNLAVALGTRRQLMIFLIWDRLAWLLTPPKGSSLRNELVCTWILVDPEDSAF